MPIQFSPSPHSPAVAKRFWGKVNRDGPVVREGLTPCGVFDHVNSTGYGQFNVTHRQPRGAHRIAWELTYGPIPKGLWVLHRCDNRICVRPDHLWLGTSQDNSRDMVTKGRSGTGDRHVSHTHPASINRGEKHGCARLTEAAIREIRSRPTARVTDLAAEFRISKTTIRDIRSGRTWKHLM